MIKQQKGIQSVKIELYDSPKISRELTEEYAS